MQGVKYSVITFGCRVNQADSLGFEDQLLALGARPAESQEADLIVVNTCSVTASADQGARQAIRRIARTNPGARIVVTGCYATRRPEELLGLARIDRIAGNDVKPELIPLVVREWRRDWTCDEDAITTADRFGDGEGSCGARMEPGAGGRTAFTLRVQTGCAEPCSYCIIPETRGRPRSVPIEAVLKDTRRAMAAGFKEIVLSGVHLGSYGRDLHRSSTLEELLRALAAQAGCNQPLPSGHASLPPVWFRISSLEPMDCTQGVVALVSGHNCFAPHFHLPLQHAADGLLSTMRRPYTIADYSALVDRIRAAMPGASIGTDVIAGFPGETDEDFEVLASYLQQSPLTHVHVFPYSDRPGTAASMMPGKVPGAVIRNRARQLRDVGAALTRRFRQSQIGSVHRALTLEDGTLAVTGNYLKVRIPPGRARNEWVQLRLAGDAEGLRGEACDSGIG
jgi:threonylcarbamoyladenosine tRNA methylthiotransferase MtaB